MTWPKNHVVPSETHKRRESLKREVNVRIEFSKLLLLIFTEIGTMHKNGVDLCTFESFEINRILEVIINGIR